MAQFDRIASIYDRLKFLVFGSSLDKAAAHFVKELSDSSNILFIGGGSGAILKQFSSGQQIDYIELSEKMLDKARRQPCKAKVSFIHADIIELELLKKYDTVITPFILDCFDQEGIHKLFAKIYPQLKPNANWLQTDFYPQNIFQEWLVSIMYLFFSWTVNLKVSKLPSLDSVFKKFNFIEKNKVRFKRGLIQSRLYQKID